MNGGKIRYIRLIDRKKNTEYKCNSGEEKAAQVVLNFQVGDPSDFGAVTLQCLKMPYRFKRSNRSNRRTNCFEERSLDPSPKASQQVGL